MIASPITVNTVLYCRKWGEMIRFYRDQLQLPVHFSNNWFMEFLLTPTARLSIANDRHSTVKSAAGNGLTLTLEVDEIEKIHRQMLELGIGPTDIRKHPWDAHVFYLFDPDGNRIEIWQNIHLKFDGAAANI
jgi:catechol 2,3-dioxygenase-like lactoylglutathione lyase family enzyme